MAYKRRTFRTYKKEEDPDPIPAPPPKPKKKPVRRADGLFGNKKGLIQDSGNCGAHVPVTKHPPE